MAYQIADHEGNEHGLWDIIKVVKWCPLDGDTYSDTAYHPDPNANQMSAAGQYAKQKDSQDRSIEGAQNFIGCRQNMLEPRYPKCDQRSANAEKYDQPACQDQIVAITDCCATKRSNEIIDQNR